MKIAFVTTQSLIQSTVIGRIVPIGKELAKKGNDISVLIHDEELSFPQKWESTSASEIRFLVTGKNPFTRTADGKKRLRGIALVLHMLRNAIRSARELIKLQPDCIVLVKPLPENTFAVALAKMFIPKTRIVLDVDDFELFANKVTSLMDRFAIHASERLACSIAKSCIVATPFLEDHIRAIAGPKKDIVCIPTGYSYAGSLSKISQSPTILYIGSVSASSGHNVEMLPEILARVRKEIPDANLIIAGSGDDEVAMKKDTEQRGLTDAVHWFGRFSDTDIPGLVAQSAAIIDPIDSSIVNRAKSSFRTMLACAAGLPIITSNIGIRSLVVPTQLHDKFFALPGDAASYAEKTTQILRNALSEQDRTLLFEQSAAYSYEKLAEVYYSCCI